ncbi:hypothetical protein HD554DRAFT_2173573 [Boletus coccyginus]|nr:hypothetical protein HD554DRAFT_2173573 [Boletus coccyginus]
MSRLAIQVSQIKFLGSMTISTLNETLTQYGHALTSTLNDRLSDDEPRPTIEEVGDVIVDTMGIVAEEDDAVQLIEVLPIRKNGIQLVSSSCTMDRGHRDGMLPPQDVDGWKHEWMMTKYGHTDYDLRGRTPAAMALARPPRPTRYNDSTGVATLFTNEMYAVGDKHFGSPTGFSTIESMADHYNILMMFSPRVPTSSLVTPSVDMW